MEPTSGTQTPATFPALELVPTCELCGSDATVPLCSSRDRLHGLPGTFGVVRCARCGLVRLSPRPRLSDLGRYYPEEYLPHRPAGLPGPSGQRLLGGLRDALREETLAQLGYPAPRHRPLAPLVRLARRPLARHEALGYEGFPRYVEGGRALDVGCGNGLFLALLRRRGWQVVGIEASPEAAQACREQLGLEVLTDTFPETGTRLPEASFDFVCMRHVLEHLPSPLAALRRAAALLRPGGTLYVETPNAKAAAFRLYGTYWFPLDSPRHLYLFDPTTLARALQACGFELLERRTTLWRTGAEAAYLGDERAGRAGRRDPARPRPALRLRILVGAGNLAAEAARLVARDRGDILWVEARRSS